MKAYVIKNKEGNYFCQANGCYAFVRTGELTTFASKESAERYISKFYGIEYEVVEIEIKEVE